MSTSQFEFHVEEVSMEAILRGWLPRFLPETCTFGIYAYSGKNALLRKLGNRLQGYAAWMPAEYRIVVVVDRDRDDCHKLKSRLENICEGAGFGPEVSTAVPIGRSSPGLQLKSWKRGISVTGKPYNRPTPVYRRTFQARLIIETPMRSRGALGKSSNGSSKDTGTSGKVWPRCRPLPK